LGRVRYRRLVLFGIGVSLWLGVPAGQAAPNVVVILSDDQPVGTVGRMAAVKSDLQEQGISFRNAMVPTSNCCPSRASLLTGLFAHDTRVFGNGPPYGGWPEFQAQGLEDKTIAVALHHAGYRTGLIGKYLNRFGAQASAGYVPPGWDTFLTFKNLGYYNYGLSDGTFHGSAPRDYSTDVLRKAALGFIRSVPAQQPLFLYFAPFGPHRPSTPAPRHKGVWRGRLPSYHPPSVTADLTGKPPWIAAVPRPPQWRIDVARAKIQESLMAVDDAAAAIVDTLAETGRLSKTLIVYLSDNGVFLGDHHLLLRKNLPYDRATRVPMIIRWDGHVIPNTKGWRLTLNVDVARTIATAAGVSMPADGVNLLGSDVRDGFPVESGPRGSGDNAPTRPAYCGFRTPEWLYVQYASGEQELYSYEADPWEVTNLAGRPRYQQRLNSLRTSAMETCAPVPPEFAWPP
jgi:N-acetylglucosamine-6-sulfatase